MPRGDKSKYTDKQERKAEHIEHFGGELRVVLQTILEQSLHFVSFTAAA
jgi:hypothetical protein